MSRLRLTGGTVVRSLHPVILEDADLLIDGDRVIDPGGETAGGPMAGGAATESRIDCSGCLVLPGNVCAHTHAYSALARGMPYRLDPPTTFLDILRRIWWRLDRALDPASIRASALVAAAEALRAGTTTLIDHHASPTAVDGSLDIIGDAFAEVGIRSVLCYETSDRDGPQVARAGLRENERFARRTAGGHLPLARAMVGAHASFTLGDESLAGCADLARTAGIGLHIHVAEDAADESDALERCGVRAVERLHAGGALDDHSLLAHGVWLDDAEIELIRDAGATVVHNARSNLGNQVGHAPLARLGHAVALGTDGIGADLFEEGRVAFLAARAARSVDDPSWALGRLAVGAVVAGGSFGEPDLGRLVPGAPADVTVLDYAPPSPLSAATFAGHWLYGISASRVRDVLVAGRVLVRDHGLVSVDEERLAHQARDEAARLWDRLDAIGEHPFATWEAPP
jgi:putative selenium metabolism protein SsnA